MDLTAEIIFDTISDWRENYRPTEDVPDRVYEMLIEIQEILKDEFRERNYYD